MESQFQHKPLDSLTSIRLITVLKEKVEGKVACAIHQFDQGAAPVYQALSYVWGDPKPTRAIFVDGLQHTIHENLWAFLNQVWEDLQQPVNANGQDGQSRQPCYYWTDALSLDQANPHEVSEQVARMGQIYSQADRAIVWLGAAAEESSLQALMQWPGHERLYWRVMELTRDPAASSRHVQEKARARGVLEAANRFLAHPYWERAWILQEAVLARRVVVKCGAIAMELEDLEAHLREFTRSRNDPGPAGKPTLWKIQALRDAPERRQHLWGLIMEFELSLCSRKVDKVYGMLGLAIPDESTQGASIMDMVEMDFTKDAPVVFWDTLFGLQVPFENLLRFLRCMGRIFFEGGLDAWDFRNLESYARSASVSDKNRKRAESALRMFDQLNIIAEAAEGNASKFQREVQISIGRLPSREKVWASYCGTHEGEASTAALEQPFEEAFARYHAGIIGAVIFAIGDKTHEAWKSRQSWARRLSLPLASSAFRCYSHVADDPFLEAVCYLATNKEDFHVSMKWGADLYNLSRLCPEQTCRDMQPREYNEFQVLLLKACDLESCICVHLEYGVRANHVEFTFHMVPPTWEFRSNRKVAEDLVARCVAEKSDFFVNSGISVNVGREMEVKFRSVFPWTRKVAMFKHLKGDAHSQGPAQLRNGVGTWPT